MKIKNYKLNYNTTGNTEIIDITDQVREIVRREIQTGSVLVHSIGSTTGITTIEYEPALAKDLKEAYQVFAKEGKGYHHDATWQDANGHSHIRSSITGTSKVFPVEKGEIILGTWQQIVFIDFDTRPRKREIIVQVMGI